MDDLAFLEFEADLSSPRVIAAYDELPLWSAMSGLLMLEHVPLAGVARALDIGCGTGFPLIELAERLGPAAQVHGVDFWPEALRRAAEKIAARGTPNVTMHQANASALPFAAATFDLIVSNLGINNFDDRANVVRECRRVARQGATLALTTNLQGHMREFYQVFDEVLADDDSRRRLREHIGRRATIAGVCELLEGGGFEVTCVIERQAVMRFANGTALLNHHFIKLGFLEGWRNVVPGRERDVFARLRGRLDALGELRLTIPIAYIEGRTP
ncbi:MAG TPA: class I SAM-dependent methyltransferase [Tepidisphaeraceae bacterium]|jgi:SAM-dependent methyltransferase